MSTNRKLVNLISALAIITAFCIPNLGYANNSDMNDAKITAQVKSKLMGEKAIPSRKITVETKDGVVCLKGTLPTKTQASKAIEVAESVDGVKDVDTSKLSVYGSSQPLTDSYITAKVKGIFMREKVFGDRPVAATDVKVETKDGVVYLSGEVENQNLANTAVDLAKQVQGVTDVQSTIKVR